MSESKHTEGKLPVKMSLGTDAKFIPMDSDKKREIFAEIGGSLFFITKGTANYGPIENMEEIMSALVHRYNRHEDLLEALKEAVDTFDDDDFSFILNKMRTAIAKAEGDQDE